MKMLLIVLDLCFMVFIIVATLAAFNRRLPRWFCDNLNWHLPPIMPGFDGTSFYGDCPRCGKFVMKDSQGNWFWMGD